MSLAEDLKPIAGIGHNKPPSLAELMADRHVDMLAEVDLVLDRATSLPKKVSDEISLGRYGDVSRAASKLKSKIDTARLAETEPHRTAQGEINGFFNSFGDRLKDIVKDLEARATDYQRAKAAEERRILAEQARQAREEEDRQRRIAEEATAKKRDGTALKHEDRAEESAERARRLEAATQASAADLTRVRSSSGTVATTRTSWDFEIKDLSKIPLDLLRPHIHRADLEKAIRAFVKTNRDAVPLAGVRIFENSKAAFR